MKSKCRRKLKRTDPGGGGGGGGGGNDSESHGWMVAAGSILREFEAELVMATKQDGYDGYDFDDEVDQHVRWSFSGALLFSITVITTIGTLITADAIFLIFTSILVCWSLLPPIFVDAQTIHNCKYIPIHQQQQQQLGVGGRCGINLFILLPLYLHGRTDAGSNVMRQCASIGLFR